MGRSKRNEMKKMSSKEREREKGHERRKGKKKSSK